MRRMGMRAVRAVSGFTLLEVVTAVFIFLLGIVGVISLFTAGTMLHRGARNKARVALAVPWVMQRIEEKIDAAAREGKAVPEELDEAIPGFEPFRYRAELAGLQEEGGAVQARVRILWKEKGRERGVEFDWIFRPGPSEEGVVSGMRGTAKERTGAAEKDG